MNNQVQAKKVYFTNSVFLSAESEIVTDERLEQLRTMPFVHFQYVENVVADSETEVHGLGGVTPAFKKMWESLK